MSTKNKILIKLENNRDKYISGEKLADFLNFSRNAIHKAIKELRNEGYEIEASPNKGYRLHDKSDVLSPEGINLYLNKKYDSEVFVFKTLPTTNLKAKQMALDGGKDKTVIVANEQTEGRGRMGRTFYSPADTGIYMSVILRPNVTAKEGMLLTTCAAVSVCKALENIFKITPQIKWVNDILLNGKKICGISTEAVTDFESGNLEHVIIGIGVNVKTEGFPRDIENKAGSILSSSSDIVRNKLIAEIANSLFKQLENVTSAEFIEEYRRRSVVIGKDVIVLYGEESLPAKAVDIDDRGGLIVDYEDGSRETLISGEISIRGEFYNHGKDN